MKLTQWMTATILCFSVQGAFAEISYTQLVSQVIEKLPHKASIKALSDLKAGYQTQSQSWLADDVSITLALENDQLTGDRGYQSWEAGADFAVSLPSQRQAGTALGKSTSLLQNTTQHYLRWLAEQKIRHLVWTLKKAQTDTYFKTQSYEHTLQLVMAVEQAYQAGEKPKIDWLLAKKSLKQQEQLLQQSQANLTKALSNYEYWTGESKLPAKLIETGSSSQTIKIESHPKLALLTAQLHQIETQKQWIKAQQAGHPEIYLGTKSDQDNQTSANQTLIAQLSIPLGINPGNKIQLAEINQQLSEQSVQVHNAKQSLETGLQTTLAELQAAQKMLQTAKEKIDLSRQTFELSEMAYQAGSTHIQNLLLIRQAYFEDQLNVELAQLSVYEKHAQLNQILGVSLP